MIYRHDRQRASRMSGQVRVGTKGSKPKSSVRAFTPHMAACRISQ